MQARSPITPAFWANAVAFPDIPSRSESRLISEISAGNTEVPPSALVRASVPDAAICPWPTPLGAHGDRCVKDAPRRVVENDIDGGTGLDRLKAALRKHADNCNLILDDEGHRRVELQCPVANGQLHDRHVAVGGCANSGLG